ncbi:amidohydrolase family protein [Amycolatopsis nigrescens]|uniref:amidohydrolase family protein n=1 Tax=Amycolatopsis nigrescens TaxID=381445 RepID=UPI00058F2C8F|nr:amidohydrolase family protein [Amycolatopsis nigrescens]
MAADPSNTFLIRGARIFDGVRVTGTGSVLVVDGRIAAIGRAAAPPGTPVHDGRGKTVLPGLIDGHRHSEPYTAGDLRDALRLGVTTELDLHGEPEVIAAARRRRESLGRTDLADLWSAGWGVKVPGGLPEDDPELPVTPKLGTEDDPDQFVADRFREGSDYLKVFYENGEIFGLPSPTLTPGQLHAVIAAAHRRGRMAIVHATELEQAKTAVHAGADGLAHMFLNPVDDAFIQAIRRGGAFITTTLSTFDCGLGAEELLNDARVRPYLSAAQLAALKNTPNCPPGQPEGELANLRRLHAAGVPIIAGTDAGVGSCAHGATMLAELCYLVRAGMSPAQALTAATATPAEKYRLTDRGRIATGLRADLLLVNGNPAEDVTALREISAIWKNGHPVDRTPDPSTGTATVGQQ